MKYKKISFHFNLFGLSDFFDRKKRYFLLIGHVVFNTEQLTLKYRYMVGLSDTWFLFNTEKWRLYNTY